MICPICGREVDASLSACDMCGTPLETIPAQQIQQPTGVYTAPYQMGNNVPVSTMYFPPMPNKKKKRKRIIAVVCVFLAIVIAAVAVVSVFLSQPEYVIWQAYNKTFVESENLSFEISIGIDGEYVEFEGAFARGETPEENLFYFMMDDYMKIELGMCNGKLYTSLGEFDMEDPEYWSELETVLADEYEVEADLDGIYEKLTDEDITDEEKAKIIDEQVFPIVEKIIYIVYGEEVEFPPYADIRASVEAFFVDFLEKYVVIEEKDAEEGKEYEFEVDLETVFNDFFDYMEEDETLSQVLDIIEIIDEASDEYDEEYDDEEYDEAEEVDMTLEGTIKIDEEGYIETIEASLDIFDITVEISDVNETDLNESDIKDIDVLFDINDFGDMYGSTDDIDRYV